MGLKETFDIQEIDQNFQPSDYDIILKTFRDTEHWDHFHNLLQDYWWR